MRVLPKVPIFSFSLSQWHERGEKTEEVSSFIARGIHDSRGKTSRQDFFPFPSPINSYERFTLELYFDQAKWNKAVRNRSCPSSRFVSAVMNRVERSNFHSRDSRRSRRRRRGPWIRRETERFHSEPVTSELFQPIFIVKCWTTVRCCLHDRISTPQFHARSLL